MAESTRTTVRRKTTHDSDGEYQSDDDKVSTLMPFWVLRDKAGLVADKNSSVKRRFTRTGAVHRQLLLPQESHQRRSRNIENISPLLHHSVESR